MITKISASTSTRSGNQTTGRQASSVSRSNKTGHLTVFVAWGLIVLALVWGLYESVQLLNSVIPKF
jgi:hypothetical protein